MAKLNPGQTLGVEDTNRSADLGAFVQAVSGAYPEMVLADSVEVNIEHRSTGIVRVLSGTFKVKLTDEQFAELVRITGDPRVEL